MVFQFSAGCWGIYDDGASDLLVFHIFVSGVIRRFWVVFFGGGFGVCGFDLSSPSRSGYSMGVFDFGLFHIFLVLGVLSFLWCLVRGVWSGVWSFLLMFLVGLIFRFLLLLVGFFPFGVWGCADCWYSDAVGGWRNGWRVVVFIYLV